MVIEKMEFYNNLLLETKVIAKRRDDCCALSIRTLQIKIILNINKLLVVENLYHSGKHVSRRGGLGEWRW